jgi:hypothetical protein
MKKIYYYIFLIISLFLFARQGFTQVIDIVEPTVAQFSIVRGAGDANYNGAVDVTVPLLTVPGVRGLNYEVTLRYIHGNGVPVSTSSSWVGLGWNLENYQITCDPVNDAINLDYYYYLPLSGNYIPDHCYLTYPGGSTEIWLDESGNGTPAKWSAIKINAIQDGTSKEYKYFIVYGIDGTRYIFGHRLRKSTEWKGNYQVKLRNHDLNWNGNSYYYVFKLTAILSSDYVDGGGDPNVPGDGGTDSGGWIKLSYGNLETFRSLKGGSYQEVDYVSTIITPTHTATFTLGTLTSRFIIGAEVAQLGSLRNLSTITLSRDGQGETIKVVTVHQSHGFDWLRYDGYHHYHWRQYGQPSSAYGRLRLDSLTITGSDGTISTPSYKFDYYYDFLNNIDFTPAPSHVIDNWGYLASINDKGMMVPENYYLYGMLRKLTYPTGGTIEFAYEPHYFQPAIGTLRYLYTPDQAIMAGGLRIKSQTITDPQSNVEQVYHYHYGSSNTYMEDIYDLLGQPYPGVGFVSTDPGPIIDHYNAPARLGANLRTDVHYPDVTIVRPDGSSIKKYFTASFTNGHYNDGDYRWMYWHDDVPPAATRFFNLSGWPDFSPVPYAGFTPYTYYDGHHRSYQNNDISYVGYDFSLNYFHTDSTYGQWPNVSPAMYAELVKGIAASELLEFDDCNANVRISASFPDPFYQDDPGQTVYISGHMGIFGIDNSWKRGYPMKEEMYSSDGSLVWSREYYYDMILRSTQDYRLVFHNYIPTPGYIHFTACSGQMNLVKTVEKTY